MPQAPSTLRTICRCAGGPLRKRSRDSGWSWQTSRSALRPPSSCSQSLSWCRGSGRRSPAAGRGRRSPAATPAGRPTRPGRRTPGARPSGSAAALPAGRVRAPGSVRSLRGGSGRGQLAQLQFAHHVILAARALGVAFGEQVAEALALGRADDQQDALAVAFQRGGAGLGGFNHGGRPPASAPAVPIRRTALRPGSPAAAPRRAGWCLRRRPSWRFRRPCRSRCAGSAR